MAIVRIPIEYLSKAGIEDGPFYLRAPIMKVRIRYDPDHGKGLGPRRANNWERVAALIDSGADLNYADPAARADWLSSLQRCHRARRYFNHHIEIICCAYTLPPI